jgi:hypothetical protein
MAVPASEGATASQPAESAAARTAAASKIARCGRPGSRGRLILGMGMILVDCF